MADTFNHPLVDTTQMFAYRNLRNVHVAVLKSVYLFVFNFFHEAAQINIPQIWYSYL